jgi:thiol:disulfide interchange protein DsbC
MASVAALALGASVLVLSPPASAAAASTPQDPLATLKATLQQRYPEIKIESIEPAPVAGLYEVRVAGRIIYVDASGEYLLLGKLVETRTRRDLTAAHLDRYRSIDFHKLPFERAIKIVKGNGRRQLALFADPDCPYCRELEKELRSVTDLTVYVFLYPLESLHPEATAHARAIWCSPDRATAWTEWMLERTPPPAAAGCAGDPVSSIQDLAGSLQISSTPTMFLESGRRLSGALKADELQAGLDEGIPGPAPAVAGALRGEAAGDAAVARGAHSGGSVH